MGLILYQIIISWNIGEWIMMIDRTESIGKLRLKIDSRRGYWNWVRTHIWNTLLLLLRLRR